MAPTFEQLCKCIPKSLKRIKRNNIEYSKIPYESIDLDLYEPEARCATFRIPKKKLEAWIYAITKCIPHPLHIAESDPPTTFSVIDKYLDDKGHCVSHEPENITVVQYTVFKSNGQCQTKLYTLHLYLSTGVVEIQGNFIQRFYDHEMKRLTDLVSSYIESKKSNDSSILTSTEDDLFDLSYSEKNTSNTKLGSPASPNPTPNHLDTKQQSPRPAPATPSAQQQSPLVTTPSTPQAIHPHNTNNLTLTQVEKSLSQTIGSSPSNVHNSDTIHQTKSDGVKTPSPDKETFLKKAQQLKEKNENIMTKLDDHVANINTRLCSIEETTTLLSTSMVNLTQQVNIILTNVTTINSKLDSHCTNVNNQKSAIKSLNETVKKVQSQADKSANNIKTLTNNTNELKQATDETKTMLETIKKMKSGKQNVSTTDEDIVVISTNTITPVAVQTDDTLADTNSISATLNSSETAQTEHPLRMKDVISKSDIDDSLGWTTVNQKVHKQRPTKLVIEESSKSAIISDSMFKGMTTDMFSPQTHITTIGGATVIELTEIIRNTPTNEAVNYVYIHVGHNDSKSGPNKFTKSSINDLINAANETFPKAVVYISAVLPNRDNKNWLNMAAFNECMKDACSDADTLAIYIDLTDAVKSPNSNLPRRDYYRDPIHLSYKGTNALAEHVKPLLINLPHKTPNHPTPAQPPAAKPIATKPTAPDPKPPKHTKDTEEKPNPIQSQSKVFHTKTVHAQGNVFQGHSATVHSREDVKKALAALYSDPKLSNATSIMYCYRFRDSETGKVLEDAVEDHEHAAGQHMMRHITQSSSENVFVAVSREFSCHIHMLRWNIIEDLTVQALSMLPNYIKGSEIPHDRQYNKPVYTKPKPKPYYKPYSYTPKRSGPWMKQQNNRPVFSHEYPYRNDPYNDPYSYSYRIPNTTQSQWNIPPIYQKRPPLLREPTYY